MKFLILATVLTLAVFAYAADDDIVLQTDEEKKEFADAVVNDLEKKADKKCLPGLKKDVFPPLKDAIAKHVVRIIKGEPVYKDESREFDLVKFVKNSNTYKEWEKHELKCAKSFAKGIAKGLKSAYKTVKGWWKKLVKG